MAIKNRPQFFSGRMHQFRRINRIVLLASSRIFCKVALLLMWSFFMASGPEIHLSSLMPCFSFRRSTTVSTKE
jgi:hypothetical protein